jgi:hypothetical protein
VKFWRSWTMFKLKIKKLKNSLILWCRHTCNHPQEEIVKFGYKLERRIWKFKNPTIFWCCTQTYCLNMAITETFSLKTSDFWRIFFTKILLTICTWLCFVGVVWKCAKNTQTFQHSLPSLSNVTFVIQGEIENLYEIENLKRKEFK